MRRGVSLALVAVVAAALVVLVARRGEGAAVELVSRTSTSVTFRTLAGRWTVFTACLGPRAHGGRDLTVGPGYIARVVREADGAVVTDDERPTGGGNTPGNGGLGQFGWHASRRHGQAFDYDYAWTIDGRRCAADDWVRGRPARTGVGVTATRVVEPAVVSEAPDGSLEGRLGIDVLLADNHVGRYGALVRVAYRYRFQPSVVHVRTLVTELCDRGRCGPGAAAFVKEPKVQAAVVGGGYTRMAVFDDAGNVATSALAENRDGAWSSRACLWMGVDATGHTGQCDADDRVRLRFDFGDYGSGADGRCGSPGRCLDVVMRAAAPGGGTAPWEGSGLGLDGWAVASAGRARYAPTDSALDGVRWDCKSRRHDPDAPPSPAGQILRRWELGGHEKDASGGYTAATAMFPGWEGGRGYGDCEPQARLFGPRGETWSIDAEYSFGA